MALAFNTSDIIDKQIETNVPLKRTDDDHLDTIYELPHCSRWIQEGCYKKVALQFPDEMLIDATCVALKLEELTSIKLYILGPSSYGSCCVNEIGAEHASVDAIIHFGHSCLTPPNKFPVLHVFGRADIDIRHAVEEFERMFPSKDAKVILLYDVIYRHAIDALGQELKQHYCNIFISTLVCSISGDQEKSQTIYNKKGIQNTEGTTIFKNGRCIYLPANVPIESCSIFHIGEENLLLANLFLSFSKCPFCSYNPITKDCHWESPKVNKTLMKRFYLIERAKDAKIVGIVVGTVGISKYLDILDHLRNLLQQAGKKCYTLVIGKPSVTSLGNFPDMDVFVLVSCLENSLLDSKELYRPIVTPFEMEMACNLSRQWTGEYIIDFREILPGGSSYLPLLPQNEVETDVSLISGKIRSLGVATNAETTDESDSVMVRNKMTAVSLLKSGEAFLTHTWQGLEQKLGETPAATITEGRIGIASGYEDEGQKS